jgi:hypothetical protein
MNIKSSNFPGIFLLFLAPLASAQKLQGFNIDVSLAKYGSEIGPDKSKVFYGPLLFLNSLKLGVCLNGKSNIRAGFRRQPKLMVRAQGETNERVNNSGYEVTLGYERIVKLNKKLTILPELGIFYDHAKQKGEIVHQGEWRSAHHKRTYTGFYPELKFAYQLSKHVSALAGVRLRMGSVQSELMPPTDFYNYNFLEAINGFALTFDQVSTISVRYTL